MMTSKPLHFALVLLVGVVIGFIAAESRRSDTVVEPGGELVLQENRPQIENDRPSLEPPVALSAEPGIRQEAAPALNEEPPAPSNESEEPRSLPLSEYERIQKNLAEFQENCNAMTAHTLALASVVTILEHQGRFEVAVSGPVPPFPAGATHTVVAGGHRYWITREEFPGFVELQEFLWKTDEEDARSRFQRVGDMPDTLRASITSLAHDALAYSSR